MGQHFIARVWVRLVLFQTALMLLVALAVPACGQTGDSARVGGFLVNQFTANDATARWLVRYDKVAWVTSDLVTALPPQDRETLGQEWFCFEQSGGWQAIYGRYDTLSDRYTIGVHYRSQDSQYVRTNEPVDTAMVLAFGRALHLAETRAAPVIGTRVAYNVYIRRQPDGRLQVWQLPAWQRNGVMAYGVEVEQTIDSTGRTLVDSVYAIGKLRGIRPDTTLILDIVDEPHDVPTVGELFFVYSYYRGFAGIRIFTRRFISQLLVDPVTKQIRSWTHVVRRGGPRSGDSAAVR